MAISPSALRILQKAGIRPDELSFWAKAFSDAEAAAADKSNRDLLLDSSGVPRSDVILDPFAPEGQALLRQQGGTYRST